MSGRPYDQAFQDRRKNKDLVVPVVAAVVGCKNWEKMCKQTVFVRSLRYDEVGSDDSAIE